MYRYRCGLYPFTTPSPQSMQRRHCPPDWCMNQPSGRTCTRLYTFLFTPVTASPIIYLSSHRPVCFMRVVMSATCACA
ncbi:hypothetical protein K466DRAFT_653951, partial [Polyporus arcularius HHB13444]